MIVFISYQYFLPAYKAGGPIQSINNTATFLSKENNNHIYILCSDTDLGGEKLNVQLNTWIDFDKNIKVYYNSSNTDKKSILNIIAGVKPDVIFINGLYSLPYTIYPLLYKAGRKILSVRGMLHPGALSQKKLKKQIFLNAFKVLGLHRKCEYHATTEEEVSYIWNSFGKDNKVWMVPNLPNVSKYQEPVSKPVGEVRLVSISLISPMKNIMMVLQALKNCSAHIIYHIYGPIKDETYWEDCLKLIPALPQNVQVTYKGVVVPQDVKNVLCDYHYFILPSKSENFGHAIYEALSAGKPVITSHNTPWNGLEKAGAGYNVNPEDINSFTSLLNSLAPITEADYKYSAKSAREYILAQYDINTIKEQYKKMFSLQ